MTEFLLKRLRYRNKMQSPSWEANSHSASQKIWFLCNPKDDDDDDDDDNNNPSRFRPTACSGSEF
jgi:hypothetical protein